MVVEKRVEEVALVVTPLVEKEFVVVALVATAFVEKKLVVVALVVVELSAMRVVEAKRPDWNHKAVVVAETV